MRRRRCLAVLGVGLIAAVRLAVGPAALGASARTGGCPKPGLVVCAEAVPRPPRRHALLDRAPLPHERRRPGRRELPRPERRAARRARARRSGGRLRQPARAALDSDRDAADGRALRRAVAVPGVSTAQTGVVVVDLDSSRVIYALNPETPLEPASTEKLPLATALLQRLGAGFRMRTAVLGRGRTPGRPGAAISSSRATAIRR